MTKSFRCKLRSLPFFRCASNDPIQEALCDWRDRGAARRWRVGTPFNCRRRPVYNLRRLHHIHRNIGLNSRDSSASIATRRVNRIVAGGLGPDNVIDSISAVQPVGVDSKTKTDKDDGSHTKDLQKVSRFVARAKSRQQ